MPLLFIDDDPEDYDLFCEAVASFNSEVECRHCLDGEEALEALKTIVPDYIFLDVNMPLMGGEECLR